MNQNNEVLVFGSGVSGLVAAYYLNKKGFKVSVIDPYNKPILQTLEVEEGIVELAANSILFNESAKKMFEELDLEYSFYKAAGKKKYFFRKNIITRWPLNFFQSLSLIGFFFKFIFFKKSLEPKKQETLKLWSLRTLPTAFYERVFKRALQGVYGPNVDNLSANLVLSSFFKPGAKGLGSVSFYNGMSTFPKKLKEYLKAEGVSFKSEEPKDFSGIRVISTPAHSLPNATPEVHKKILSKVSYHNISTITLFVDEKAKANISGFGVVFEDVKGVLGLIFNSDLFDNRAKEGLVSETWILEGGHYSIETEALSAVLDVRERMNGKFDQALVKSSYFKNWSKAFPVYDLNLEEALSELSQEDKVYYFANWTGSLGIGKMMAKGEEFSEIVFRGANG